MRKGAAGRGARPVHRPRAEVSGVRRPSDKLLFYSARVLEKLGRREEAERYYGRVIAEFPDSEFARKARSARGGKPRRRRGTATANPPPKAAQPELIPAVTPVLRRPALVDSSRGEAYF